LAVQILTPLFIHRFQNVLKHSFSHSKWVLQAILSLTVPSNCVYGSSNFDTAFLPDCTTLFCLGSFVIKIYLVFLLFI